MNLTTDFKTKVIKALITARDKFEGSDAQFARKWGMSPAIYSRLKNGETDRILKDSQWLNIGRELNVSMNMRAWKMVRTSVFNQIEEDVLFCKKYSKSIPFCDKNEIGKTFAGKYLSRTIPNCFYVPCSQCNTKPDYIRRLAKTLGLETSGTITEIEQNIIYYLNLIENPVVINDDPGDMNFSAFFSLKKFWDGTEGTCGWYILGDEALRKKWENAMRRGSIGFKATYSRYGLNFQTIVPASKQDKMTFYRELVSDVLIANAPKGMNITKLISKCIIEDEFGNIGGLRRAESLLILNG
jgi:hypothetical protein